MTATQGKLYFKLTTETPYLALTGKLWGVYYDKFEETWPLYNGTALYYWWFGSTLSNHWSNVITILNFENIISWFIEIARSYDKTFYSSVNTDPESAPVATTQFKRIRDERVEVAAQYYQTRGCIITEPSHNCCTLEALPPTQTQIVVRIHTRWANL